MNETATKKPTTKPIKTVRRRAVAASIWKRQAQNGLEYFDFSLSRSWKATTYSPNFFVANEDALSAVVRDATSWIASQQAGSEQTEQKL